jgi:hypothetical protein
MVGNFPIVIMNYRSKGIKNVERSRCWVDSLSFATRFKVDDDDDHHHYHHHIHINNVESLYFVTT